MKVTDFDYILPDELIAQFPAQHRQDSRMLAMDRDTGECSIHPFTDIVGYFNPGDCLVINDTKVLRARLWGHKSTGSHIQAFVLKEVADKCWQCMLRPGKRLPPGTKVDIDGGNGSFTVQSKNDDGTFVIRFDVEDVLQLLEDAGQIPLPPYINRQPTAEDQERYQTVYATHPGAVAAPTAGLHFTDDILAQLENKGVRIARLTLHVGAGTFKPVSTENIEDHQMHEEIYILPPEAAAIINETHASNHRVFCVGTTTVRVLETCVMPGTREVAPGNGKTSIFLYPPYKAIVPDCLLTNFHLPKSTLLMLICTFAEHDKIFAAYKMAIENKLRFYSYGDCMLLHRRSSNNA